MTETVEAKHTPDIGEVLRAACVEHGLTALSVTIHPTHKSPLAVFVHRNGAHAMEDGAAFEETLRSALAVMAARASTEAA